MRWGTWGVSPVRDAGAAGRCAYRRYCELFNAHRFWDAHEVLEEQWQEDRDPFKQGLILFAAAFVHVQRNNPAGCRKVLRKAIDRLTPFAPRHEGWAVDRILAHARLCLDLLDRRPPDRPLAGYIPWIELAPPEPVPPPPDPAAEGPLAAVLLDFDGTVADTMPLVVPALQQVFREFDGVDLTWAEVVARFGPPEEALLRQHLRNRSAWPRAVARYLELYRERHGRDVVRSPELEQLLRDLRSRGVRLGVVTGKGRASARISLAALGMEGLFDAVITGDDVRRPKPDPEGVRLALARLGVAPGEAIFVGDTDADVAAGRAAGLVTVGAGWFAATGQPLTLQPDHFFTRVAEFREYLEARLAAPRPGAGG